MKRVPWLTELSHKDEYWLIDKVKENNVPLPIITKYSNLHDMAEEGNVYGVLLRIKDLYESIIKIPVVMALINIKNNRENEFFTESMQEDFKDLLKKLLFGSLSMGEWKSLAEFISSRRGNNRFNINETLYGILRKTSLLFEQTLSDGRSKIVTWRNETIGHGCIKCEDDEDYRQGVSDLLNLLKDYFEGNKKYSINNEYAKIFFFENDDRKLLLNIEGKILNIYPYVIAEKLGEYYFDSYYSWDKHSKYICYKNGKNRSNDELYFDNLIREYAYADAQTSLTEGKFSTNTEAEMLEALNDPGKYITPVSLLDKLKSEMESLEKGTILIQMERGTGKSAFAYAIDNLYGLSSFGKPFLDDSIVRVCRISAQQLHGINDFLSVINEDFRHRSDGTFLKNDRGSDNEQVKQLRADSVFPDADLTDILMDYQEAFIQKQWITEDGYIVLVLDGIDELIPSTEKILDFIPSSDNLPYGIFIVMTSRYSDEKTVSEWSADCIEKARQKADSIIAIQRDSKENIDILEQYIKNTRPEIPEDKYPELIEKSDYRFLYLKVFLQLFDKVDMECSDEMNVIKTHLDNLMSIYTKRQQETLKHFCLTIAVFGRVSLEEYIYRYGGDELTYQMIGIVNDILPLLTVKREKEGNYYEFADSLYNKYILAEFANSFPEVIRAFLRSFNKLTDSEKAGINTDQASDNIKFLKAAIILWDSVKSGSYVNEMLDNSRKFVQNMIVFFSYLNDERFSINNFMEIKMDLRRCLVETVFMIQKLHISIKDAFGLSTDSTWITPMFADWVKLSPEYDSLKERLLSDLESMAMDRAWLPFLVFNVADADVYDLYHPGGEDPGNAKNVNIIVDHIEKAGMLNDLMDYMVEFLVEVSNGNNIDRYILGNDNLNNYRNALLDRKLKKKEEERLFNLEACVSIYEGDIERAELFYEKILDSEYALFNLKGEPYDDDMELTIRDHTFFKPYQSRYKLNVKKLVSKKRLSRSEVIMLRRSVVMDIDNMYKTIGSNLFERNIMNCRMIFDRLDAKLVTDNSNNKDYFLNDQGWEFLNLLQPVTLINSCSKNLITFIEEKDKKVEDRVLRWIHMFQKIISDKPSIVFFNDAEIVSINLIKKIEQKLLKLYISYAHDKEKLRIEYQYCLNSERKEVFDNLYSQSELGTKWFEMCIESDSYSDLNQSLDEFETAFIKRYEQENDEIKWQLTEEVYKTILLWESFRQSTGNGINGEFCQCLEKKYHELQESYEEAYKYVINALKSDTILDINTPKIISNMEICFMGDIYREDKAEFYRKWNGIEKCLKTINDKYGSNAKDIIRRVLYRLLVQEDQFLRKIGCAINKKRWDDFNKGIINFE